MQERENVLRILEETKQAIQQGNTAKIKELSNQTINTASLMQDNDNIAVAVIVYSIGKILERQNYKQLEGWNEFYSSIGKNLDKAISNLKNNKEENVRRDLEKITSSLKRVSGKLQENIQFVFNKAKVNKASRIYEHGVSMGKTANLLGVSMYDLADYSGKTGIPDVPENKTLTATERIKIAEEIFG